MWWRKDRERGQGKRRPKKAVLEVQALEGKALLSGFGVSGEGTQAYVDSLYANVLHRAPDAAGEAYWVAVLDTSQTGPRQVLRAFERAAHRAGNGSGSSVSAQATANGSDQAFVDSLYTTILHRQPDAQGEADWVRGLETGMSRAKIARMFARSPEALAANGGKVVSTSAVHAGRNLRARALGRQRVFVDRLYSSILQRPADAAGEAYYLNQLRSGVTRQQIFNAIVASSEAQSLGVNPLAYSLGAGYRNGFQLAAPSNRVGLPATPLTGPTTAFPNGLSGVNGTGFLGGNLSGINSNLIGTNSNLIGANSNLIGANSNLLGANSNLLGSTIAGGLTPLNSSMLISPISPFPTGGYGLNGFGVGGLTPYTSLGSTALITPGLNTTGLGAFGSGALSGIGTLSNVMQTNGLSGVTIGNTSGTGGTGI